MSRRLSKLVWLLAYLVSPASAFGFWNQLTAPSTTLRTGRIPESCRILILPGFGNDSSDYTRDGSLVSSLTRRGWDTVDVLPVERSDWLQVFLRGVLDWSFWQATLTPTRPAFSWYLERVAKYVESLDENESVILVAHSAGGWLARAAMGFGQEETGVNEKRLSMNLEKILGLVTLGAPNQPPPPAVMDMTRGALRITNEKFPGAFHAPLMFYVTVIGNAVRGKKQERKSPFESTTRDGFAYNSYEAVCGDGSSLGDGVVPLCAAHVEDALKLELDGVFHSINVPEQWYGADSILDQWHAPMMDEVDRLLKQRQRGRTFAQPFLDTFISNGVGRDQ